MPDFSGQNSRLALPENRQGKPLPDPNFSGLSVEQIINTYPVPEVPGREPVIPLNQVVSSRELIDRYGIPPRPDPQAEQVLNEQLAYIRDHYGQEFLFDLQQRLQENNRIRQAVDTQVAAPLLQYGVTETLAGIENGAIGIAALTEGVLGGIENFSGFDVEAARRIWGQQRLVDEIGLRNIVSGDLGLGLYNNDITLIQNFLAEYTIEWLQFRYFVDSLKPLIVSSLVKESGAIKTLLDANKELSLPFGVDRDGKKTSESPYAYSKRIEKLEQACIQPTQGLVYDHVNRQRRLVSVFLGMVTLLQRSFFRSSYPKDKGIDLSTKNVLYYTQKILKIGERFLREPDAQENGHVNQDVEDADLDDHEEDVGSAVDVDDVAQALGSAVNARGTQASRIQEPISLSLGMRLTTFFKIFGVFGGYLPVPAGYFASLEQQVLFDPFASITNTAWLSRPDVIALKDLCFFLTYYTGFTDRLVENMLITLFVVNGETYRALLDARAAAVTQEEQAALDKELADFISKHVDAWLSFSRWMNERAHRQMLFNAKIMSVALIPFWYKAIKGIYSFCKPLVASYL